MYFAELNVILSTCLCLANGISFNGFGNGYRFLIKEINETLASFDSSAIITKWIQQPLDHFDKNEKRTWRMRYFERLDKWRKDGPVYLFLGGEGEASPVFLQTGILYELANETNGAMFLSEHRFYGKSKPFKNLSTENLKFLSSRQALSDISRLLRHIKQLPIFNASKIVIVGGSYAGNLAAWMKLFYPKLVDAVLASSAPVLAKKDFFEYLENVSDDFEQHGTPECLEEITNIFKNYDELFKTKNGIERLKEEEDICDDTDMAKPLNKQLFFLDKSSEFMYKAQYGNPDTIKAHCEGISNHSAEFLKDETIWNEKKQCYDYDFDNMIESMRNVDWIISWTYQTCTEFGYFPSSSSEKQPFTENIRMDLFYEMCIATFGPEFDEARIDEGIVMTNEMYAGLKPNVTNVVFVNGDLDPYHRLGILEDVSYDAPAKVISGVSHCRDLFSNRSSDPEELIEARIYIKYLIKKWIGVGDYKKPQ